ncbi:hypothetical protein SFRURICE_017162 [Spodoptera frugiperda]|nr:hypothetical protein SFRURICE_017162 [Spodoptera frugiperda]
MEPRHCQNVDRSYFESVFNYLSKLAAALTFSEISENLTNLLDTQRSHCAPRCRLRNVAASAHAAHDKESICNSKLVKLFSIHLPLLVFPVGVDPLSRRFGVSALAG